MSAVNFSPLLDLAQDAECAICQNTAEERDWVVHEADTRQADLKVQHIFHKNCLKSALETSRICPMCRKDVNIAGLFTESEINTFIAKEAERIKNREQGVVTRALYTSMLVSSILLYGQYIIEDWSGIMVRGIPSCFANMYITSIATAVLGRLFSNVYNDAHINLISIGGAFFGLALSAVHLIDPFCIRSFFSLEYQLEAHWISTLVYQLALSKFYDYYPPVTMYVIRGEQMREAQVRSTVSVTSFLAIIAALLARNAWHYYQD